MVVLDAVHNVQAKDAPDLAVRWNCKAGKCGSCSAEINGKPALMCMTQLAHLPLERSEEHTSELQSRLHLVCRLLLEKKKTNQNTASGIPLPPLAERFDRWEQHLAVIIVLSSTSLAGRFNHPGRYHCVNRSHASHKPE